MDKSQSPARQGPSNDGWTQFEPSARIRLDSIPEGDEGGESEGQGQAQATPVGHLEGPSFTETPGACRYEFSPWEHDSNGGDHSNSQAETPTPQPGGGVTPVPNADPLPSGHLGTGMEPAQVMGDLEPALDDSTNDEHQDKKTGTDPRDA
eukprot:210743-Heterocapsa_arctica.AAC.1